MSDYTYHLTPQSYIIPLLHAAHHLSSNLNGIFLGRITSNQVTIEHVIPLLHNYISLTPMMEIGLELADVYASEKGLKIVGYYQANKNDDNTLGRVGERVLDGLRQKWAGAFGMVIDNQTLGTGQPPYVIYLPTSPSSAPTLKPLPSSNPSILPEPFHLPSSPNITTETLRLIREDKLYRQLGDFDDHLEDVRIDWLNNPNVTERIRLRFP